MMRRAIVAMSVLLLSNLAYAAGGDPVPAPTHNPDATPGVSAEERYNAGLALRDRRDWRAAEAAFREAIQRKADFPEAWNELGHALKNQKKFEGSLRAYNEALRLRPDFPQALEYLGEAYVQIGKMDDARAVYARLQPLDARYAAQLQQVIMGATARW
jgi:tetratricopeptide (TPR) repeat protein